MKKQRRNPVYFLALLAAISLIVVSSCKKDDEEDPVFTMQSLMAGDIDLAGVTSATDVPEDATIEAVFSSAVDGTTVTAYTVLISNDDGSVDLNLSVSGSTVTISPVGEFDLGTQFTVQLTSGIKGTNGVAFAGITLTFRTSGIFVPQAENQVLYLSFDNEVAEDEAGAHTVTASDLSFVDDRRNVAGSAVYFSGDGNIIEIDYDDDLLSASQTISFWFKTNKSDFAGEDGSGLPQQQRLLGLAAGNGYHVEMGRRSKDPTADGYNEFYFKIATTHINVGANSDAVWAAGNALEVNSQRTVTFEAGVKNGFSYADANLGQDPPDRAYLGDLIMDKWTHVVMTHDAMTRTKTIYINGTKMLQFQWISTDNLLDWTFTDMVLKDLANDGVTPVDGLDNTLALGFAAGKEHTASGAWADYNLHLNERPPEQVQFFIGALDQVRMFSVPLSEAEVQTLYDNEK